MTVAKFVQPNYLTQTAAAYKAAIDAAIAVLATAAADYACHAKDTPDMQVLVDAGQLFLANSTLVSNAQQTSATIVAPVTDPRIDRIVINDQTGVVSIIAGTEAASPTAPAITAGTRPIAQILLQTSSTVIANSMITDERVTSTFDVSAFIRTLLPAIDAAAARATLGAAGLGANTFTNTQIIQAAVPKFVMNETGVAADNGRWQFLIAAEDLYLQAVNDADTVAATILSVQRTGTVVDSITFGGPVIGTSGTFTSNCVINGIEAGRGGGNVASNTAFGDLALNANTTGGSNTAIGSGALSSNTVNGNCTAVGQNALTSSTGPSNTACGKSALTSTTSGDSNTAVGQNALFNNTTGFSNTAIGLNAGSNLTTGTNDSLLGNGASASSASVTNEITLGNASIATLRCQVTTITALSDARDKKDIEDLPLGLDFINALRPVKFTWARRDGTKAGIQEAGFIAQELDVVQQDFNAEDYLQLVYKSNPEKLEATPGNLLPILVKAIQELAAQNAALEARLTETP